HSIIGESFPRFGEGEIEKTFGVTHEGRCTGARHMRFIWVQLKEVESRRYKMGSRMDVEVRCVVSGLSWRRIEEEWSSNYSPPIAMNARRLAGYVVLWTFP